MRNTTAAPRHTLSAETISLQRYIKAKVPPHTQNRDTGLITSCSCSICMCESRGCPRNDVQQRDVHLCLMTLVHLLTEHRLLK